MATTEGRMSRNDRGAHEKLLKRHEKTLNALADQRAAERADKFKKEITEQHKLALERCRPVRKRMAEMQAELDAMIAAIGSEYQIAERALPSARLSWQDRSDDYYWDTRRKELEKAAESENAAIKKADLMLVNMHMTTLETKLLTGTLDTPEGIAFLEEIPKFAEQALPEATDKLLRRLAMKALPPGIDASEE